MARVTIITAKGTERVPAERAAKRIESGEATLDESDERGVVALASYIKVRRTPLKVPQKKKTPKKKTAPKKKAAKKKAAPKKKTAGKKRTAKGAGSSKSTKNGKE